jgi:hypothetical protein
MFLGHSACWTVLCKIGKSQETMDGCSSFHTLDLTGSLEMEQGLWNASKKAFVVDRGSMRYVSQMTSSFGSVKSLNINNYCASVMQSRYCLWWKSTSSIAGKDGAIDSRLDREFSI